MHPADIITVSELQDQIRGALERTRQTRRPIVVTQRGQPAGVLLDVAEYERLVEIVERAELEEDIARGERAPTDGDLLDWEQVKRERLRALLAE